MALLHLSSKEIELPTKIIDGSCWLHIVSGLYLLYAAQMFDKQHRNTSAVEEEHEECQGNEITVWFTTAHPSISKYFLLKNKGSPKITLKIDKD